MLCTAKYKMKPPMSARLMPGHPLADGLVGFWPMLRESSIQVFDLSGNGNHGTLVSDTHFVPGKFGSALSFDGTGDWVSVPDSDLFSFGDGAGNDRPFSVGGWFNISDITLVKGFIAKYGAGAAKEWRIYSANSRLYWEMCTDISNRITCYKALSSNIHQSIWLNVFCTYDGSKSKEGLKIYINGVLQTTVSQLIGTYVGMANTNQGVTIGSYLGANSFLGLIDLPMIYNRDLTASEIALIYREPFCMFDWEWLPGRVAANGDVLVTPDPASAVAASMYWIGISSAHLDSFCGEEVGATIGDALDGTDYWAHIATETHWFILDLDKTYNVQKIKGRSETTADPTVVNIYVSDNKENWGAAVASGIDTLQDTSEWVEVDTTNKNGRYVKVEITDTEDASDWLYFGHSDPSFTIFDVYVSVDPTVVIGDLIISPTPASAVAATVAPTVVHGSLTISPTPASAVAATVAPTVEYGSLTIEPAEASAIAAAIDPTVESSLLNITPSPAYAIAAKVDPTVVLGSITIEPTPAAAVAVSIGPYFADEGNAIFLGANF